jgi:uncharacterized membrane protein YvlD (DUF360 family)
MTPIHQVIGQSASLTIAVVTVVVHSAAAALPLILLALGLFVVVVVAVLRPTPERQAMVDRLGKSIKDVCAVIIAGPKDRRRRS